MVTTGQIPLRILFRRYIYFFNQAQVNALLEYCEEHDLLDALNWMRSVLIMSESELQAEVGRDGDEEDMEPLVNVFLWKQREGLINKKTRISYRFWDHHLAWMSHRYMVANDYPGIEHLPVRLASEMTTYAQEIQRVLDIFESSWAARDVEDVDALLASLNVIGPRINLHPRLDLIGHFADFVMDHCFFDETLSWLSASNLTMLAYDLGIDVRRSWPSYQFVLHTEPNRDLAANIPAWILGLRMYGERAAQEIEQVASEFDIDLLKRLAYD